MPNTTPSAGDRLAQDPAMQQYFHTLPAFVQESIKQCSIQPQSLQELQQCAQNLLKDS